MQLYVLGLIDHAHAVAAELLDEAVVRDGLANRGLRRKLICNVRRAAIGSQRGAHRWKQERAKPSNFRLSQALPTRRSKRVFPQKPQVDNSIGREIRVRASDYRRTI